MTTSSGAKPATMRWRAARLARDRIRDARALAGPAVALQAIFLVLMLQFAVGALAALPLSEGWVVVFSVLVLVTPLLGIASPSAFDRVLARPLGILGRSVAAVFLAIVLSLVFLLTLVPARLINRPVQERKRPWLQPWIGRHNDGRWRMRTWRVSADAEVAGFSRTSGIGRAFSFFSARGNRFLAAIAVVLVILAILFMFLHTSAAAPFIYTLF